MCNMMPESVATNCRNRMKQNRLKGAVCKKCIMLASNTYTHTYTLLLRVQRSRLLNDGLQKHTDCCVDKLVIETLADVSGRKQNTSLMKDQRKIRKQSASTPRVKQNRRRVKTKRKTTACNRSRRRI